MLKIIRMNSKAIIAAYRTSWLSIKKRLKRESHISSRARSARFRSSETSIQNRKFSPAGRVLVPEAATAAALHFGEDFS